MENGEWRMDNGQWTMDNGEWKMENGPLGPQGRFFQSLRLMKASPFGMPSGVEKRSKNGEWRMDNGKMGDER